MDKEITQRKLMIDDEHISLESGYWWDQSWDPVLYDLLSVTWILSM